ncbi:MAG: 2-oxo acid dehydrogenase subunit E2 [Promethearchaeota archaeon]
MKRYDATKPRHLPRFRLIEPHVMRTRDESVGYFRNSLNLTKTLPFIEKYNRDHNFDKDTRLTLFHIILCATARTFALYPHLNRFISGRKYWQHNRLQFSFVVKKKLKAYAKETFAKIDFDPFDTLEIVRKRVHAFIYEARSDKGNETEKEIDDWGKYPRWLLMLATKLFRTLEFFGKPIKSLTKPDPLYCSVIFANLGSVGLPAPYHHIFEWGNASWFITVGKIYKKPVVNEAGEIVAQDTVDLGITLDERISEGLYYALGLKAITDFIENPEKLISPPEIPEENLLELALLDREKRLGKWDKFM